MAHGRLGAADLAATTDTLLYTVPAGQKAIVNVIFVARNAAAAVRLALTMGSVPAAVDYLEYDFALPLHEALERTQIPMAEGQMLYARASVTGVTAMVLGIEKAA